MKTNEFTKEQINEQIAIAHALVDVVKNKSTRDMGDLTAQVMMGAAGFLAGVLEYQEMRKGKHIHVTKEDILDSIADALIACRKRHLDDEPKDSEPKDAEWYARKFAQMSKVTTDIIMLLMKGANKSVLVEHAGELSVMVKVARQCIDECFDQMEKDNIDVD